MAFPAGTGVAAGGRATVGTGRGPDGDGVVR